MSYHNSFQTTLITTILLSLTVLTTSSTTQPPTWLKPYIIDFHNGTVIRDTFTNPPSVVPPPNTPFIHSKDITITPPHLRARLFIPAQLNPAQTHKLPILLYFHGGAFCIGSPSSPLDTLFSASLSAHAHALLISFDYRLFPDVVVPSPYDDAWAALTWIATHGGRSPADRNPWLAQYGDLTRVYIGGDSAGGNIAHNVAMRAGFDPLPNGVELTGVILAMPYFLGLNRVPLEPVNINESTNYKVWSYVCNGCRGGVDSEYINPFGPWARRLSGLGCKRVLVYTAEIDELRGRGRWYYEEVKRSGWLGQAQLIEAQGKRHVFHILDPDDPATARLIQDFSAFLDASSHEV